MNAKNIAGANAIRGLPTEKLKKIRINRKDFKKGGDGLRGKNVTEQFRVKEKDMKRTMKWHMPELSMKNIREVASSPSFRLDKPNGSSGSALHAQNDKKKHERPRKLRHPTPSQTEDGSSDDILDEDDEEISNVYRKIPERREELNRARRNGDDCHVSWYPVSFGSEMNSRQQASLQQQQRHLQFAQQQNESENILLLHQEDLLAVCNGKSSSIERARAKRSSKI